jgi:hypothetical protein
MYKVTLWRVRIMCVTHRLSDELDTISQEERPFLRYIAFGNNKKYLDFNVQGQIFELILTNLDWMERFIFYKRPPVRNFTEIRPVGFTRREKQTDMTKLVDFC